MNMQRFSRAMKYGSFALILAGFVGSCAMANANDKKKRGEPPRRQARSRGASSFSTRS